MVIANQNSDSGITCGIQNYEKIDFNVKSDFEVELEMSADNDKAIDWISNRFNQLKNHWKDISQHYPSQKSITVLVYMGLLDKASRMGIREGLYTGGPLGEMIQWTDLLIGLNTLRYNITLITDLNQLIPSRKSNRKSSICYHSTPFPYFDYIITDIIGAKHIQRLNSNLYSRLKCKLRVLDSFGTQQFFNSNVSIEPTD